MGLRSVVVVEVGRLMAAGRSGDRARPGHGVLTERDARLVLEGVHPRGGQVGQGPGDGGVDPGQGALRGDRVVHRLDRRRGGTVARRERRPDGQGPRARVLLGGAGVGTAGVGGVVDPAAAEELETGGQPVGHDDLVGGMDVVVVDRDGVHGLVIVDAAGQLGLGARLRLGHGQRRDLGRTRGAGRVGIGRGPGDRGTGGGVELGNVTGVRVGEDTGVVGVGRAGQDGVGSHVGSGVGLALDLESQALGGAGLEVGHVRPDQGGLALSGLVVDDGGVGHRRCRAGVGQGGRTGHVGHAHREDLLVRQVVHGRRGRGRRVVGGERHRSGRAVEDGGRGRLAEGEVGCRRPGDVDGGEG